MNESQRNAILSSLSRRLSLIQGPPGTGKTHVMASIVEQFIHLFPRYSTAKNPPKILVSAFTNAAVDVLTKRLDENGIDVLRLGRTQDINAFGENSDSLLENFHPRDWGELVKKASVISSTSIGCANALLKKEKFDLIICDETTQSSECGLLPALVHLKDEGSVVLIGDHKQLPPTVTSREACRVLFCFYLCVLSPKLLFFIGWNGNELIRETYRTKHRSKLFRYAI